MTQLLQQLRDGLVALGQEPDEHPCEKYLAYVELLGKWNRTYNLSGIRDPERMISYHLLDSLSLLPFLHAEHCLDAGTGAGLPGLVLAIARPELSWVLLDSNLKKTRFLSQAIRELAIPNAVVAQARLEQYEDRQRFNTITSRALGSVADFHRDSRRLLAPGGVLLAMKGKRPEAEIEGLDTAGLRIRIHPLSVPGISSARSVVEIEVLVPG